MLMNYIKSANFDSYWYTTSSTNSTVNADQQFETDTCDD